MTLTTSPEPCPEVSRERTCRDVPGTCRGHVSRTVQTCPPPPPRGARARAAGTSGGKPAETLDGAGTSKGGRNRLPSPQA